MEHKGGIIGYGGMANWHFENAPRIPFEYVAAYDIDPERRALASEKGMRAYSSAEEFLKDDSFDIVLVATPNNFHKDYVIAALEAGKNVICEKPVAMSVAELDEMTEAAQRAGRVFTVHQNRRWDADMNIIKKVIDSGKIGKPFTVESRVLGQNGAMYGWRAFKVAGGGMIFDWGVHLIDQIIWMFGESVTDVYCVTKSIKVSEVDDYFKLILSFESGMTAQIEVGTFSLEPLPRWYVCGDEGAAVINTWECDGRVTHAKDLEFEWMPMIIQTKAGPTRTMSPRPKHTLEELALPKAEPVWEEFYRNVIAAVDGTEPLLVKPSQARYVLRIIEAAFESAETGRAVKM